MKRWIFKFLGAWEAAWDAWWTIYREGGMVLAQKQFLGPNPGPLTPRRMNMANGKRAQASEAWDAAQRACLRATTATLDACVHWREVEIKEQSAIDACLVASLRGSLWRRQEPDYQDPPQSTGKAVSHGEA